MGRLKPLSPESCQLALRAVAVLLGATLDMARNRLRNRGRVSHLLDHLNDRHANPRVGDPQECSDESRTLLGIIGL